MDENYVKFERIWMKNHPQYKETWVHQIIKDDPSVLGLGDLELRDHERSQPGAGRLDLLLHDSDAGKRYEVEVQLGKTDEKHIIRTLEYWDLEKKRWPTYDHCAVIVAEEITNRFFNVIGLFNGCIPIIAIQMSAIKVGENVSLVFTVVLNQRTLPVDEEDEVVAVTTDRSYWENRAKVETVSMVDRLLQSINNLDSGLQLNYTKYYIGLTKSGINNRTILFRPQKSVLRIDIKMEQSPEITNRIEEAELDLIDYRARSGRYRVRLRADEIEDKIEILEYLFKLALEQ